MKLFIHHLVATALFNGCLSEGFQSSQSTSFNQDENEGFKKLSVPRRTLTFTYNYDRQKSIEDTLHLEDDSILKFESNILHQAPSESPNYVLDDAVRKNDKEPKDFRSKTFKKNKTKRPVNLRQRLEDKQSIPSKGSRKLQNKLSDSDRASLIESLYNIQIGANSGDFQEILNAESGTVEDVEDELILKAFLSSLEKRSDSRSSSSRSRSKGKGKRRSYSKGKGKRRSYSKGKGSRSYSSSSSNSSRSRSRSRKKKKSRSYSGSSSYSSGSSSYKTTSSAAIASLIESDGTFNDEFVDFLSEYYGIGDGPGSKTAVSIEEPDGFDGFEEFLNNYYKFKEGKSDGNTIVKTDDNIGDNDYTSEVTDYYPKTTKTETETQPSKNNSPSPPSPTDTYYYYYYTTEVLMDDYYPKTTETDPSDNNPSLNTYRQPNEDDVNRDEDLTLKRLLSKTPTQSASEKLSKTNTNGKSKDTVTTKSTKKTKNRYRG